MLSESGIKLGQLKTKSGKIPAIVIYKIMIMQQGQVSVFNTFFLFLIF
jgi:hypothetical protein